VTTLAERRVDGLILASAHRDAEVLSEIPTVLVNRTTESKEFPAIVGDDRAGIGLVVRHLAGLGHTAIAHVAGPQDLSTGVARRVAFVEAMAAKGLDVPTDAVVEAAAFRTDDGRRACEGLLDSGVEFTAIVAGNDLIALGCCDALAGRGILVPAEVSVTGYNDMTFIDRVAPPLTTVAVAYREMGATAARTLLISIAEGGEPKPHDPVLLPPELVIRVSTAPPAQG
jgi:LacI family transcriptional regulator